MNEHIISDPLFVVEEVVSSSDRNFILANEKNNRSVHSQRTDVQRLTDLGGMSGAAVFVTDHDGQNGRFGGIMYEAAGGLDCTIIVHHGCFINADGTIDHSRMPW